jgi:nitrite reductase/ring-hydroxylating ferredoxin subunit
LDAAIWQAEWPDSPMANIQFGWIDNMAEFVKVAEISEIPAGEGRAFTVGDREIAIFNIGGTFYATDDTCTHQQASLAEGELQDELILCPLHFAAFDVTTGEVVSPPADEDLKTYPVKVEGDAIFVMIEED